MNRIILAVLLCMNVATSCARAEWPDRPVTIVAPFAAGGSADFLARLIADRLHAEFRQTVAVENKAGAGGSIGAAFVAKAQADGYTLLVGSVSTHAINPAMSKLSFDPNADFEAVVLIAGLPNLLVVTPSVPARSVPELIAYLKANPGKATFASAGIGTSQHLAGELFRMRTGLTMTHVPYKGAGEIMAAVIAGEVTLSFNNMVSAWPAAKAGQVHALAVTSLEGNASAPGVPTVAETLPGFDATSWFGLFAPKGTPAQVVERLARSVTAILNDPEIGRKLADVGAVPVPLTGAAFARFLADEQAKWRQTVDAAGLKQQ